jgi:hypothetical protein
MAGKAPAPKPAEDKDNTVTIQVTPGVLVFHDGAQRGGTLQVPREDAEVWAARGWVTLAE